MSESTGDNKKVLEDNHENLSKFQEWISTQPHIPKNIREQFL